MEEMDWEEAVELTDMGGGSSVPAGDLTQDDEQAIVESFSYPSDTLAPGNAAGRPHKRRDSLLDGRYGKRTKNLDIGGGSGPTDVCDVRHSQRSGEESELPSSSGHPTETAWGNVMLDHYGGSLQNEQHFRSLGADGVKHRIFLSHSGAQKDFVEQLCVDLKRGGYIVPFFDQRDHSLPKGEHFTPLIKEAAQHCHVAVIVLSKEFLCSKWPMIELAEFHAAQQRGNQRLNMLPLFYKLSVEDLGERAIEERWMSTWRQLAKGDERIEVAQWIEAVRALRKANGLVFGREGLSEVGYRKDIVRSVLKMSPPALLYGSSRIMVGYSRLCKRVCDRFVRGTSGGPSFLCLYGTNGTGKTTLSKALCDHFSGEYMGRVCHVELGEPPRMGKAYHVDLNEASRLRRVKQMLERLCGLDKEVLDRISDFDEGLTEMQTHMKRKPVFLAIDNVTHVTNDSSSWKEAGEYLMTRFHPESRIMITSRSRSNFWGLVPDIQLCVPMPRLSETEAGELFLRSAAPSKSIFKLTAEERRIVWLCIQQCLFKVEEDEVGCDPGDDEVGCVVEEDVRNARWMSYHPMALSALGDFFRQNFSNVDMLRWRDHLEGNKDPLWDLWKVSNGESSRNNLEQEESELPSSSGRPTKRARDNILDHYGGKQNVQHFSSLQLVEVKHKVFLSHSGEQKDFAEQLCVDLERRGFIAPFFDQRLHSLLKGKDFAPLIKEAAKHCHVAVVVLSEEFLCSKWPMIELAEFHAAQQAGNQRLNMLPLFYKLSVQDLDESAIEERWKPMWKQLANSDARIDVEKWSDAVRALRKVNGVVFGQKGLSEVGYRKNIVRSIFKLSPPDLLNGSSRKMVGYSRLCKTVCDRFVRGMSGGPSLLGLYGTSGAGKTTLSKALCNHFNGEYMGRVCHVDLGETPIMGRACHVDLTETSRLRRVKQMLERLCGLDKEVLDRISDFDEGLELMHTHMKREPVFLAMDNVTNDGSSWDEAHEYLMVGFHRESRIMITSRSRSNIGGLVPDIELCVRMPRLIVTEAGELFLRSADPSKSIFELTAEERRIVWLCIQQCLSEGEEDQVGYDSGEDEVGVLVEGDVSNARWKRFHPLALSALGDFLRRYFGDRFVLRWRDLVEENRDPLWYLWKVPNGIGEIIGLQFHSLPPSEQLLFLDIAAFVGFHGNVQFFIVHGEDHFEWLYRVHDETRQGMERRLQDLERFGMIRLEMMDDRGDHPPFGVAHDIYEGFAKWYLSNHGVKWLKNALCVFRTPGSTLNQDFVASDLVRLRMFDLTCNSAWLFTSKMMRELHSLEVLQLYNCPYLSELNLEGLKSLRCLELKKLQKLVAVTLTESSDMAESGGIFKSLKYVVLEDLDSLVHGPNVRLCTSLHEYYICRCPSMTNLDEMESPHLKVLWLEWLVADQLKRLPNVKALPLEKFYIDSRCYVALSNVEASRKVALRDVGKPYWRVVEELVMYLHTEWVADDHISTKQKFYIYWSKEDPHSESLNWHDSTRRKYSWR